MGDERSGLFPATVNNPKNLTHSEVFKSISDQLPDDLLVQVHLQGLNAKTFLCRADSGGDVARQCVELV
jgi:hypothetical protein